MRRFLALAVAIALTGSTLAACSSVEGAALLDAFIIAVTGEPPLTSEENPTDVQAAGGTVDADDEEDDANGQIRRALRPDKTVDQKIKHAENAIEDRPGDPLYYIHLGRFHAQDGNMGGLTDALVRAKALVEKQYEHISDPALRAEEIDRRFLEINMEATLTHVQSAPEGEYKDRLQAQYCTYRQEYADEGYRGGFLGSAYWDFTIDHSQC